MTDDRRPSAPPPLPPALPPAPRKRAFWRTGRGVLTISACAVGGLLLLLVAAVGLAFEFGYVPDTCAVAGEDLPDHVVDKLRAADVLGPDEEVLYYYSGALWDHLEDGNLCTDRRVVSYWTDDGELFVTAAPYEEIVAVEVDRADAWYEDTTITVRVDGGLQIELFVAGEDEGDEAFEAALRSQWRRRR